MKKLLALVLALVMTLGLATVGANAALSDYSDANAIGADYEEAFAVLNTVGVFQGSNRKLNPAGELTRAEAAKLIAYLDLGAKTAEALPAVEVFPDVPATHWASKYVAYCYNAGIIQGSSGKYLPDDPLTGYAFAAYVLAVLGYDRNIEGMTGANWQIATAKLMSNVGLTKGVDKAGSATLTRQEAAQYCLNALKANTVEYTTKGTTVTIEGVNVVTGASTATPIKATSATERTNFHSNAITTETTTGGAPTAANPDYVQLGEKLYAGDLTLVSVAGGITVNSNNHKAHKWQYDSGKGPKDVTAYAYDDVLIGSSYDGTDLYAATGKALVREDNSNTKFIAKLRGNDPTFGNAAAAALVAAPTTTKFFVNGTAVTGAVVGTTANLGTVAGTLLAGDAGKYYYTYDTTTNTAALYVCTGVGAWSKVDGKGVLIELFDTNDDVSTVEEIHYTTYQVGIVNKAPVVKTNPADSKDYVYVDFDTVNGDAADIGMPTTSYNVKASKVTGYEGLVKNDIVTVVAYADGTYVINKLTPVTGKATAKNTTTNKITVDGTGYDKAANANAAWAGYASGNSKNGNFYLDQYGYGVYAKAINASSDTYLMILENAGYGATGLASDSNKSYVVFDDGTTATIVVSQIGDNTWASGTMTAPMPGTVYSYEKLSDGTYYLISSTGSRYIYDATSTNITKNGGSNDVLINTTLTNQTDSDGASTKGASAIASTNKMYTDMNSGGGGAASTIKANAETKYIFRDITGTVNADPDLSTYKKTWTVQTGYANHKDFSKAFLSAAIGDDGYADAIFVYLYTSAAAAADSTNYAYVYNTDFTTVYKADGTTADYYTFPAIVGGETVDLKTNNAVRTAIGTTEGLYIVNYTDGVVSSVTAVSGAFNSNSYRYGATTTIAEPDSGMIVTGLGTYGYTDDCKVFIINAAGTTVDTGDVGDYVGGTYTGVYLVNATDGTATATSAAGYNTLTEIYIQK